ncbi:hypothetical protein BKA66DRAFT_552783 [Pyrenochaeta sp. MPI-SDFR-AT-0127]|nr:hypothetical protein BKA66DRAFT_552783 [Pyrenochaeta sp. MPI-SDFR-AT-0127]
MATDSDSSFFKPRYLSDSSLPPPQEADTPPYDLVTFLGVIQKLQIDILSITWQAARQPIGAGATGRINEALINLHTSFAFKCVSDRQREETAEGRIIRALISEVMVLGDPLIQRHPNIVALQGVCWDVTTDEHGEDRVWPVLVFEKSQYGDLYHFTTLPVGRELSFAERLKLCVEVGIAISDMHINKMLHGDIKPENVLIFKDDYGDYTARVTDFGYSNRFTSEDDLVPIPKSWPWCAPEHDRDRFTPGQARKMDVFSFGMLCFWVLFENYLSGTMPLPEEVRWAEQYVQIKEQRSSKHVLDVLKRDDKLALLAEQLVLTEHVADEKVKKALVCFFRATLACNLHQRDACLQKWLILLAPDRVYSSTFDHENDKIQVVECNFEIMPSIEPLYQADYRVRRHIRRLLESREHVDVGLNVAFQLAICYHIGFGGARDEKSLGRSLNKSGRTLKELEEILQEVNVQKMHTKEYRYTAYAALITQDDILFTDLADPYRASGKLKEAEAEIKREIEDIRYFAGEDSRILMYHLHMLSWLYDAGERWEEVEELLMQMIATFERVFGAEARSTLTSMSNLASVYQGQGRWEDAERLKVQVMEVRRKTLGKEHHITLSSMSSLASTYRMQGRWKEAEELLVQVVEASTSSLGEEHHHTLDSMNTLALIYRDQGRWKESEELGMQQLKTSLRVLGKDHPSTITAMANLVLTYHDQGRWKEAEELGAQVLETRMKIFGLRHSSTLNSMNSLASTYLSQSRWKEAEELFVQIVQTKKSFLGEEHASTLNSMNNLALTYQYQSRWKEAEEVLVQVIEISTRVKGAEHPDTIISIKNLASTYQDQGQWAGAVALYVQIMETSLRVLGAEHPSTLASMDSLASVYQDQGQWEKGEELLVQVIEMRKRVIGAEHQDTLKSVNDLVTMYQKQERWEEAEELGRQSTALSVKVFGAEHPSTLHSLTNLAMTLCNHSQWNEAVRILKQVMETSLKVLGAEHPSTLASMANLASIYRSQSRWIEAEELEEQVLRTSLETLGAEHPTTLISMNNLASTWKAQDRDEEAISLMETCHQLREQVLGSEHPYTMMSLEALTGWKLEKVSVSN